MNQRWTPLLCGVLLCFLWCSYRPIGCSDSLLRSVPCIVAFHMISAVVIDLPCYGRTLCFDVLLQWSVQLLKGYRLQTLCILTDSDIFFFLSRHTFGIMHTIAYVSVWSHTQTYIHLSCNPMQSAGYEQAPCDYIRAEQYTIHLW